MVIPPPLTTIFCSPLQNLKESRQKKKGIKKNKKKALVTGGLIVGLTAGAFALRRYLKNRANGQGR